MVKGGSEDGASAEKGKYIIDSVYYIIGLLPDSTNAIGGPTVLPR